MPKMVMLFLHDPLTPIHLQKDPYQIPAAFADKGFDSFLIISSTDNEIRKITTGRVHILLLKGLFPLERVHYLIKSYTVFFKRMLNDLFLGMRVLFTASRIKPDIIISYNYPLILLILRLARIFKVFTGKIVCKLDSPGYEKSNSLIKELARRLFLIITFISSDIVIIESYRGYKSIYSATPFKAKLIVVPNGVSSELAMKLKEAPLENREKIILSVAKVERYKNLELLLEAFASIADDPNVSQWSLHFVGPIVNAKYYRELIHRAKVKKILDKVTFLGPLTMEDLVKEYSRASIFVLPSKVEGFSIAKIEACLAGLPVITTNTSDSEFFPKDLVIEGNDPENLALLLKRLIINPELRTKYGILCRAIASNFTWNRLVERILIAVNKAERECSQG